MEARSPGFILLVDIQNELIQQNNMSRIRNFATKAVRVLTILPEILLHIDFWKYLLRLNTDYQELALCTEGRGKEVSLNYLQEAL